MALSEEIGNREHVGFLILLEVVACMWALYPTAEEADLRRKSPSTNRTIRGAGLALTTPTQTNSIPGRSDVLSVENIKSP